MKTGLALFCVFGLGLVFTFSSKIDDGLYHFFPFSNMALRWDTHFYFIFEHLVLLSVLFLWYKEVSEYSKKYVLMFLFLQIGDLVDYLLRYNEPFIRYHGVPISYNMCFVALYGLFLIIMAWKER